MLFQFLLTQSSAQARDRRYVRALAMLGDDDAFSFQFVIGTLDGDDAYLKVDGKLADGGYRLAFRPITDHNPLLDLLHDLEIHGALIRLRKCKGSEHLCICSIYRCVWCSVKSFFFSSRGFTNSPKPSLSASQTNEIGRAICGGQLRRGDMTYEF